MNAQPKALRMAAVLEAFQAQWDKEHTEELIRLRQTNQELVEALEGLDEAYCRAGSPLNKQERHEDRMRLIVARRVIAKHKEQA